MLYFGICVEFYKDNYIYVIFYGKIYMVLYKVGYRYNDKQILLIFRLESLMLLGNFI